VMVAFSVSREGHVSVILKRIYMYVEVCKHMYGMERGQLLRFLWRLKKMMPRAIAGTHQAEIGLFLFIDVSVSL